jgi:iron complex transport system substrate-binding protein
MPRVVAGFLPALLSTLVLLGCSAAGPTPAPPAPTGTVEATLGGACDAVATGSPACTSSADGTSVVAATDVPRSTPRPLQYPLPLTDDEDTVVTLERVPLRIASLTPAATETLYALGAGDRLVGRSEGDDYPTEATALPVVATYTGVQVEKLVSLKPDLVIAGGNGFTPVADIEKMRSLGLPVVVIYAGSLDGVLRDIEFVGLAAGRADAARAMSASLRSRIAAIGAAAQAAVPRPRVFYELDATKEIYGPARDSFLAGMIVLAGGDPITTNDASSYAISLERLVSSDPQVIVLGDAAYGTSADVVAARPGWTNMTAIRQGAIRPVNDVIVSRPGPRIADGLAALALAINPGLVLPPAATGGFAATGAPAAASDTPGTGAAPGSPTVP